jgi:alkanesulfonate monooxygenase
MADTAFAVDSVRNDPVPSPRRVQIFSTCPSSTTAPDRYLERVIETAKWSEAAGCTGLLIYTDNSLVDPWLVAQVVIQNTTTQCPLVAVQPVYMHPYSVAKMVSSFAFLSGRRVCLNMVAGGFKKDLEALNDTTPHDSRYDRLVEYTLLIRRLLEGSGPVTTDGTFYRVTGLNLQPRMPRDLFPDILVSGSSEAGRAAARAMGAIAVKYPEPPEQCQPAETDMKCGVRIGIVARKTEDQAWSVADERFPADRKGQLTRQLATKVSDSAWHHRLAEISENLNGSRSTYWLHPFENYQTNCPYLVGSYDAVSRELARYISAGHGTYILDIPPAEEEFEHIRAVFGMALDRATPRSVNQ